MQPPGPNPAAAQPVHHRPPDKWSTTVTHAKFNFKSRTPKLQLKYLPKDVLKVMNGLPRDPVLDLMENSGPGRKFAAPEPVLRAYYLSRLPETWVPEKPHAVWSQLKENWRNLAGLCGFEQVPSWETFRKRFKLLAEEYGNEITIRQFEILQELEKRNIGKKALPVQRQLLLPAYCLTRECYRNSSPYFPPQPRLIPPSRSVPMQVHQMRRRPASWP